MSDVNSLSKFVEASEETSGSIFPTFPVNAPAPPDAMPFMLNLGQSSNPALEVQIINDVAGFGRQLGRIEDVLTVLLRHFQPNGPLTIQEQGSIDDLRRMLDDIDSVKLQYRQKHLDD